MSDNPNIIKLLCGETGYDLEERLPCTYLGVVEVSGDYDIAEASRIKTLARIQLRQKLIREHKLGKHDKEIT